MSYLPGLTSVAILVGLLWAAFALTVPYQRVLAWIVILTVGVGLGVYAHNHPMAYVCLAGVGALLTHFIFVGYKERKIYKRHKAAKKYMESHPELFADYQAELQRRKNEVIKKHNAYLAEVQTLGVFIQNQFDAVAKKLGL